MSTNFSPAAREWVKFWRGAPTVDDDNEVDPGHMQASLYGPRPSTSLVESARLVWVRLPGKRSLQEVHEHEDDRKAKIEAPKARMNQDGGGVASTEQTHHTYRSIFVEACKELEIQRSDSLSLIRRFFGRSELGVWLASNAPSWTFLRQC